MFEFLLSILALSAIVFVHELGHYLLARATNIGVEVFSVGFGSVIYSFVDKRGTKWQICAIPLGGYVHPKDNDRYEHGKVVGQKFYDASPYKGIILALAGPAFNFISAFLCILALAVSFGVPKFNPQIREVMPGSCAIGKLVAGDVVLKVNDIQVTDSMISGLKDPIVTILRAHETLNVQLNKNANDAYKIIFESTFEKVTFASAIKEAFFYVLYGVYSTITRIFGAIVSLNIMGPLGIMKAGVKMQQHGFASFMIFIANISIAIGAFNLLPLPLLDGGRILMFMFAAIAGRRLPNVFEKWFSYISIGLLGGLFLLGFLLDIKGLF